MEGSAEQEKIQAIRKVLREDGQGFETATEQKLLLHVWSKLQRTESALKAESAEHRGLKRQSRDDMAIVEEDLHKIRQLSSKKEQLTQHLREENSELCGLVDTLRAERDAFLVDNRDVVQVLIESGVHQSLASSRNSGSLKSSVENLVNERDQLRSTVEKIQAENTRLVTETKDEAKMKDELQVEVGDLRKAMKDTIKRRDTIGSDRKSLQIKTKQLQAKLEASERKLQSSEDAKRNLASQLDEMRKEMKDLTTQLENMTVTEKRIHTDNIKLRKSFKQKESELKETVPRNLHEKLRAEFEELQEMLATEQKGSVTQQADIDKLKKKNESYKLELQQMRKRSNDLQNELREVNDKLENSSQHIHSLQKDLQEKDLANQTTHRTLQKFIEEQQETLEENRELKHELALREQSQKEEKQTRDRLRKHSTTLQNLQQKKEREMEDITRELQLSRDAVRGLQLDKESLNEQLKKIQENAGHYLVKVKEMELALSNQEKEQVTERQSQSHTVKALQDHVSSLEIDKRSLSEKLNEKMTQCQKLQQQLRTENDEKDELRSELHKSQQETGSVERKLKATKTSSSDLKQELQTLENDKLTMQSKIKELTTKLENMAMAHTKATGTEEVLKRMEKELRSKLEESKTENHCLAVKVSEGSDVNARLTAEIVKYKDTCKGQKIEMDSLKQEIKNSKEKISKLETELTTLQQTLSATAGEKSSLESAISTMCTELESVKEELSSTQQSASHEAKKLQQQLNTAEERLQTLTAEKDTQKLSSDRVVSESKSQLDSMEKVLVKTEQEVAEKTANSDCSKRELTTQVEILQQELSSLKHLKEKEKNDSNEQLKKMSLSTEKAQLDIQAKEQEVQTLNEKVKNLDICLEETSAQLNRKIKEIQEQQEKLTKAQTHTTELKKLAQHKDKELQELKSRITELEKMCSESETLLDREKSSTVNLQQQLTDEQGASNKFREQIRDLIEKNGAALGAQKTLEAELAEVTKQKRRTSSKLAKMQNELDTVQAERNQLQQKVAAMEIEVSVLQRKLAEFKVKEKVMIEGEHEIESLVQELASVKESIDQYKEKDLLQEKTKAAQDEKMKEVEQEKEELRVQLSENEAEISRTVQSLQAQEHHNRLAEKQVQKLSHEKEQLRKELTQVQQYLSQQEAGLGEWREMVEKLGKKQSEKKLYMQDKLISYREKYHRERLSLESSVMRLMDQLNSANSQLQLETRWKEKAAAEHGKQLMTITHLQCKIVDLEKAIHEKDKEILQLQLNHQRLNSENLLLEQQNNQFTAMKTTKHTSPSPPAATNSHPHTLSPSPTHTPLSPSSPLTQ